MQLKNSQTGTGSEVDAYLEYRQLHRNYIRAYKKLHARVAAFSIVPEKFIAEVEPLIELYLEQFRSGTNSANQRQQLQQITSFISTFHEFMDEATRMYNEHRSLSVKTFAYLKKVVSMEALQQRITGAKYGIDFPPLVPELQLLQSKLQEVRSTAAFSEKRMAELTPLWQEIKKQLSV